MTSPPESNSDGVVETRFTHSSSMPDVLSAAGCSLLISTYQAGQLVSVGTHNGQVEFSFHGIGQAMGVAVGEHLTAVGAKGQVWFLRDQPDLAPRLDPPGTFDHCLLPTGSTYTGAIQCHEVAWGQGPDGKPDLWMVNTLFSCLAGLSDDYNFIPRWRPPFISQLAAEDRCHLNGMAMRGGVPVFVTVMAQSDEPAGWRKQRNESGTILEVPSGEPVTTGLSMPHSPRWHNGELYVLNSGYGRLEHVSLSNGQREIVALLPGYARGLAIHGNLAFVGLSRIRETAVFGGAPIAEYHDQLKCGVGVVDLTKGETIATLEFHSGVEEIFDVQVVPDTRCLTLGGSPGSGDEIWLLP